MITPRDKHFTKYDLCAYCGVQPSVPGKGDHGIARCLFAVQSHSTIRVPACRPCNLEKSRNEDYVRDFLCSHIDVDLTAVPTKAYDAFMRSANKHDSSALARAVRTQGRYQPRFTESGLFAGRELAYPLDVDRIRSSFEWITRSLYFAMHQQVLGTTRWLAAGYTPRHLISDQADLLRKWGAQGPFTLGDTACSILFSNEQSKEGVCVRSLLMFYNQSVAVDVSIVASIEKNTEP